VGHLTHLCLPSVRPFTPPLQETEAKQSAAKELVGKLAKMALVGANPDKIMDIVKDFTTTVGRKEGREEGGREGEREGGPMAKNR